MPVDSTHCLYDARTKQWERCRDCAAGEDAIKAKSWKYLPPLDSHRREREEHGLGNRYNEYLMRALFYNAVGRTIAGLSGAIFQKAPSIENAEIAQDHLQDVTLTDEPLQLFALNATKEFLTTGRCGILVDMAQEEVTIPRPYWVLYKAEDIINWRFENLGGDKELVLVVLREHCDKINPDDEFDIDSEVQYRVLRLQNGIYSQQVYKEDKTDNVLSADLKANGVTAVKRNYIPDQAVYPMRKGVALDFIPFSLPWTVDSPPLLDLAIVNLAHYRAVADLKHGLHYTALPTPWVSSDKSDHNKPLAIGSGTAWDLGKDGKAGMLEFTGRGLSAIRNDIIDMQAQMATLGARLLEPSPRYAETALSVSMRHSSDYATLRMIAQISEQQISFALKTHCWWLGTDELVANVPAKVELNKIFFDSSVTADELRALILALQGNTISFKTFYERLSNTGWTREGITVDEELADIKKDGETFTPAQKQPQLPDPKSQLPGSEPPPKPIN